MDSKKRGLEKARTRSGSGGNGDGGDGGDSGGSGGDGGGHGDGGDGGGASTQEITTSSIAASP